MGSKEKGMKKIVSLQKQSKRAQRAYHLSQRGSWGDVNPVSRTVESKKVYSRKRLKRPEVD